MSRKKTLVVLIALSLITSPVVAQSLLFFDGFEDGNYTPEWEESFVSGSSGASVTDTVAYEGDFSAETTASDSGAVELQRNQSEDGYPQVEAWIRFNSTSDDYGYALRFKATNESVNPRRVALRVEDTGIRIREVNDTNDDINEKHISDSAPAEGEWRYFRLTFLSSDRVRATYGNTQVEMAVDQDWDRETWTAMLTNDGSSTGTVNVYYDNIAVYKSHVLDGTVTSQSGSAIENATVYVGDKRAETDANGDYIIPLDNGTYDYEVTAAGYQDAEGEVVVEGRSSLDVTLEPDLDVISLDVPERVGHDERAGYTLRINGSEYTGGSGYDPVVRSEDARILAVHQDTQELRSYNISGVVNVTAIATVNGREVQTTEEVAVAELVIEDLVYLPASFAMLIIVTNMGFVAMLAGIIISAAICRAASGDDLVCIGVSVIWTIGAWAFLEAVPLYVAVTALLGLGLILFGND